MKINFLKSIVTGIALSAALSSQAVTSAARPGGLSQVYPEWNTGIPVPTKITLSAAVTYNTNDLNSADPYFLGSPNGGGTNTTTAFTFNNANLLAWLNSSATFTNDLYQYTVAQSWAINLNKSNGRNPLTPTGIMQLPPNCYFIITAIQNFTNYGGSFNSSFGGVGITNASGFWFPLSGGEQWVKVPQMKLFNNALTPVSVGLNTYLTLELTGIVGSGAIANTGGAEADKAWWTLNFNNQADVAFTVNGVGQLTWGATAAKTVNVVKGFAQGYTLTGSGSGWATEAWFPLTPPSASVVIKADLGLSGAGVGPSGVLPYWSN